MHLGPLTLCSVLSGMENTFLEIATLCVCVCVLRVGVGVWGLWVVGVKGWEMGRWGMFAVSFPAQN